MKSKPSNFSQRDIDIAYMKICFDLALKGAGRVSPNPLVGCIIVKNDKIITKGWHDYFGGPHAEAVALADAKESVKNATLYCNLEPCCHTDKKTAPCLPLVINSGIKRVVLCNRDPNPKVSGKSIEMMRKAGIEVLEDVLAENGKELNRFFFKHIATQKPWITLKIAQTLDGKIALDRDKQTWITGTEANAFVHQMRSDHDAVLVGSGTINADNPQLNVRHIKGRDPVIIILAGKTKINAETHVLKNKENPAWIFHPQNIQEESRQILQKSSARLIELDSDKKGLLNLNDVVGYLGQNKINSVLIEGGQIIFSQFLSRGLFDELIILQSGKLFGKGLPAVRLTDKIELDMKECIMLGNDCYIKLRKKV